MYRALTLKALRQGTDVTSAGALGELARSTSVAFQQVGRGYRVLLDGEDVTRAIRDPEVTRHVSAVSAEGQVRERMVVLQREIAAHGGVVMDGRDIGSNVLPGADRKFYLDAGLTERARRRAAELAATGQPAPPDEVEAEIARRDYLDSHRSVAPLVRVPDAIYLDTTGLSVDEVVNQILGYCDE